MIGLASTFDFRPAHFVHSAMPERWAPYAPAWPYNRYPAMYELNQRSW